MAQDRIHIFPSGANLVLMRQRMLAASRGLNLLKRRRDALELKLRELVAELDSAKAVVDKVMSDAIFSMAKVNFLDVDLRPLELLPPRKADIYMRIKNIKVAGLMLPQFQLYVDRPESFPLTGLARGGEQIKMVRARFQSAVRVLIAIASLEYSVNTLQDGVQQNNMRINGLEYIVIPRFQNTINYIRDELDEYEREDFYRLKRSQAKQRKAKETFTELVKTKNMTPEQLAALKEQAKQAKSKIKDSGPKQNFDINKFSPTSRSRRSRRTRAVRSDEEDNGNVRPIPEENEEEENAGNPD
ncbi:V-type proton ATPase subunit D 2-like [Anastrepha obliqua]|uniref:V-type proton ATPase subunit D 2-like n=1 Tax=Anastrepha obliqua TaxID=95512 RepID=UPI00240A88E7|nr:V-type proton ATPase subunit D 2-like [Anastrepha obliqua]